MGKIGNRQIWRLMLTLPAMLWLVLTGISPRATAAVAPRKLHSSNRVIVTLQSGKTERNLAGLLASTGGKIVRRIRYANAYTIELPGSGVPSERFIAAKTRHMHANPAVKSIEYNNLYYMLDKPSDPGFLVTNDPANPTLLLGQWQFQPDQTTPAITHINAPQAWDLEKGSQQVVVAVIDSGVRDRPAIVNKLTRNPHPDLAARILVGDINDPSGVGGGINEVTGVMDPSPAETGLDAGHGTHVAGIIAAQGNNNLGVTGVCWNNVWILPINVFDVNATTSDDIVAEAISYCISFRNTTTFPNGAPLKVNVINMSLGGAGRSDLMQTMVQRAADAGIVIVAAAGNSYDTAPYGVSYPAAYAPVIAVGATDYKDNVLNFSQRGPQLSLTAPGWQILSTIFSGTGWPLLMPAIDARLQGALDVDDNGYCYLSGTSMASPMVAGAAALLISHGVPAGDVRSILQETATPKGFGRPNDDYGWGLLNLSAALKKASIDVKIDAPGKASTVSSSRPTFRIKFRHAKIPTIRVMLDGNLLIGPAEENPSLGYLSANPSVASDPRNLYAKDYFVSDAKGGKSYVEFTPDAPGISAGSHELIASADSDIIPSVPATPIPTTSDSTDFVISPATLQQGWHLFSVPYRFDSPELPQDIVGSLGLLARWNYATSPAGSYAMYSLDGSRGDLEASFTPPSVENNNLVYSQANPGVAAAPAGLGYWLYVGNSDGIPVPNVVGNSVDGAPYVISLSKGWNMVGDPFTYPVDWAGVIVEYNGATRPIADAIKNGWLNGFAYPFSYNGPTDTVGHYDSIPLTSGQMQPWDGQWVKVLVSDPAGWPSPDLKLIIPPSLGTNVGQ